MASTADTMEGDEGRQSQYASRSPVWHSQPLLKVQQTRAQRVWPSLWSESASVAVGDSRGAINRRVYEPHTHDISSCINRIKPIHREHYCTGDKVGAAWIESLHERVVIGMRS
eukprot:GHVR01016573.1.p1 GENE.GHVR01016573.1~~GHVR01016573.1.p1  ORF type:complete len:113 (+),score=28.14 GHVR01016573.1:364-702(+)